MMAYFPEELEALAEALNEHFTFRQTYDIIRILVNTRSVAVVTDYCGSAKNHPDLIKTGKYAECSEPAHHLDLDELFQNLNRQFAVITIQDYILPVIINCKGIALIRDHFVVRMNEGIRGWHSDVDNVRDVIKFGKISE